ncbi:MAG: hypothetical protein ACK4XJ_05695 [Fimbriimonadaceae bacterium]
MATAKPADVAFYQGTGTIPRLIMFADRSDVHHVAIANTRTTVVEAVHSGIATNPLASTLIGSRQVWLGTHAAGLDPQPIVDRANFYVSQGHRYAYEQIVLLAFLTATRRLPCTPTFQRFLRATLDRAAKLLAGLVPRNRKAMICSELVYRCFLDCVPTHPGYAIRPIPGAQPVIAAVPQISPVSLAMTRVDAFDQALSAGIESMPFAEEVEPEFETLAERYLAELEEEVTERMPLDEVVFQPDTALSLATYASLMVSFWSGPFPPDAPNVTAEALLEPSRQRSASVSKFAASVVPKFVTPGDLRRSTSFRSVQVHP